MFIGIGNLNSRNDVIVQTLLDDRRLRIGCVSWRFIAYRDLVQKNIGNFIGSKACFFNTLANTDNIAKLIEQASTSSGRIGFGSQVRRELGLDYGRDAYGQLHLCTRVASA